MSIVFLQGSVNVCTAEQMQREAERAAAYGRELRDPTTHTVAITIAQQDVEAFCEYVRNLPADRVGRGYCEGPDGRTYKAPSVTFYLDGTEVTGTWTRLRKRIDTAAGGGPGAAASGAAPQRFGRGRPAPPIKRGPQPDAAAPPAAPTQGWSAPPDGPDDDDEIPF